MVVHVSSTGAQTPPRVGFVVSTAVGNAVVRNRVKRRLRAIARASVTAWPVGTNVVVRALPASSAASYPQLAHEFDVSISRGLRRVSP